MSVSGSGVGAEPAKLSAGVKGIRVLGKGVLLAPAMQNRLVLVNCLHVSPPLNVSALPCLALPL